MLRKTFPVKSFKAVDESHGVFEAIVAVFNNVDRAGDRILPGAFKQTLADWEASGDPIPVIFAHEWDNLDAHIGEVLEAKEVEDGLYVKAQLEMDEEFAARVWKKMAKRTLRQFSFAYDVVESTLSDEGEKAARRYVNDLHVLELFEVGPCLVGMNPDTQLLGVKAAISSHGTATSDAAWDGPANETRVKSDQAESYYRRIYAWKDPEGETGVKSTYKFIHHEVDRDGNPGAANIRACQASIAILNGGRGGTTVPEADHKGIWNHVAKHLRDADVEPPELKALDKSGARHTGKEFEMLQSIHDLIVTLGAKCPGHSDDEGDDEGQGDDREGKTMSLENSPLAARLAMELLEEME